VGAALLLDALFFEKYFFEVRHYHIGRRRSRKKLKLLLLTDLHFYHTLKPFHYKLARKINSLQPDLILIAGDLIDQYGEAEPLRQFFAQVDQAIPKLAIPGNHDHVSEVSMGTLRSILESNNGCLLQNETRQIVVRGETLTITGLDDFIESEGCTADALRDVGREAHHFMLIHSPLQQEQALADLEKINALRPPDQQVQIRYLFAGHNHGGQVRFGSFVPVLPLQSGNYLNGWYNDEEPYLYISKGFGTSEVPFRFGARPEITLFHYGV
jgi:predicted MPP superfamily phosphohydrolase